MALRGEVMLGGKDDAPLFFRRDARGSPAEAAIAALADFDENQRAAVAADKVDLSAAATVVARDDAQAVAFEMLGSSLFGPAAALARGIVLAH